MADEISIPIKVDDKTGEGLASAEKNFANFWKRIEKEQVKTIKTQEKQVKLDSQRDKMVEKSLIIGDKQLKAQKEMANTMRDTYRMYLPVLFISQKLGQATQNLLQPSMDILGVQDLWNTMLAVSFLPTAEDTLEGILNYGEALMNLDEETRRSIGTSLQWTNMMAQGAQLGASLAVTLGGLAGEAVSFIGALGGAAAGQYAFNQETIRAVTAVQGLEGGLILTGIAADKATEAFNTTEDEIVKLNALDLIIVTQVSRDDYDKMKEDIEKFEKDDHKAKLEIMVKYINEKTGGTIDVTPSGDTKYVPPLVPGFGKGDDLISQMISKGYEFFNTALKKVGDFLNTITGGGTEGDFIMRPGSAPVSFSPGDTIIGYKGGEGVGGNNMVVNINVSASVSSNVDIDELANRIGETVTRQMESSITR